MTAVSEPLVVATPRLRRARLSILTHPKIKGAIRARMEDILEERAPRDPLKPL